jgi:hypothetical protein
MIITTIPMTDGDKKSGSDRYGEESVRNDDAIIPGKHGKHGGSEESEGAPQDPQPEAKRPSRANGDDHNRH